MIVTQLEHCKLLGIFVFLLLYVCVLEIIITVTGPAYIHQAVPHKKILIRHDAKIGSRVDVSRLKTFADMSHKTQTAELIPEIKLKADSSKNGQDIIREESRLKFQGNISFGKSTTIRVGFFEGFRKYWTYTHIFRRPQSPRTCNCEDFTAETYLEQNPANTSVFDVLFIPQDVGFHPLKKSVWNTILSSAPVSQRRIYATFEGPNKLRALASRLPFRNKTFHWSWTYHSKSEFPMPYGVYRKRTTPASNETTRSRNWSEGKTSLMAWMSSWSVTSWKREQFATELKKHLQIDFFGKKFMKCPRDSDECEQMIQKYKFYLALENSCCSEYISEKFWRTLSWDIVPIVVGAPREDYERLAPPNSFIHADDFDSIEALASYVIYLDKNDDEYNTYFQWKTEGEVIINYPPLKDRQVRQNIPPDTFFYSCNQVCRVGKRYLMEKSAHLSDSEYFDPNMNWWCGSCTKCGKHDWTLAFNRN